MDKCYKLHGYPPGFKHRQKHHAGQLPCWNHTSVVANQVSNQASGKTKNKRDDTIIASFFQHLDSNQCHKLMRLHQI